MLVCLVTIFIGCNSLPLLSNLVEVTGLLGPGRIFTLMVEVRWFCLSSRFRRGADGVRLVKNFLTDSTLDQTSLD